MQKKLEWIRLSCLLPRKVGGKHSFFVESKISQHAEKAGKSLFDESFFKSDVSVRKYMNEKYIKPEVHQKAFHLLIHYLSLPQLCCFPET